MLKVTILTPTTLHKDMDELLPNLSLNFGKVPSFKIEILIILAKPYDHI